jgi:hypothetical protein
MSMRARGSVGAILRVWAILVLITGALSRSAQARVEIWTSPSSGYWDDFRNWSLGARPTNSDSVFITNAISETVTIDWYTSSTYPESMTISDLTVLASGNVTNTLFLSDAGTTTPLQIHDTLMILSGGALLMTNSSLLVGDVAGVNFALEAPASFSGTNFLSGGIAVGYSTNSVGSISMGDGATAFTNGYTVIGFYGSGQVSLANGVLQAGDDISVPNGIFFGLSSGSEGVLSIGGGTYLAPENLSLGQYAGSTGLVWITGGQLLQTNNLLTTIGGDGVGQLVLSNGQFLASQVVVGDGAGSRGTLMIAGGTGNFSGSIIVGVGQTATGTVSITGGQLAVTNGSVIVGNFGVGQMAVNNGSVLGRSVIVGNGNTSHGTLTIAGGVTSVASNITVGTYSNSTGVIQITGGDLFVTNQFDTGGLSIGQLGSGFFVLDGGLVQVNQLTIASGIASNGLLCCTNLVLFGLGVGQVTISNGVLLVEAVKVGASSQGTLTIAGGIVSVSSNITAGVVSNTVGVIQITGGNLTVTNQFGTGQLTVGQSGNGFLVQDGGVLMADQVGISSGSTSNVVLSSVVGRAVLSNGLLLAQSVEVGVGTNSQGTLTIAGGSISVSSTMGIGALSNAVGFVQVSGGNLAVTNISATGQLVVGQMGTGTFAQSGGVVTVDQLLVNNSNKSVFGFSSGVFNTKSTTVNNAQTFFVGDGTDAATYHLLGGIHSFANGLEVRSNAVLSGCGTINGSVVVDAGGAILADCGGTLTFTGIVTNNGSWTAINGSVLEAYGPVVNNGLINVIDGNTNFHGGFVNNGIVLDSESIPRIISVTVVGSDVQVQFTTDTNLTYVLEYTSDLVTGNWTPLVGFTGPGGDVIVTDFEAALQTQRFYRVHLVVPQ